MVIHTHNVELITDARVVGLVLIVLGLGLIAVWGVRRTQRWRRQRRRAMDEAVESLERQGEQ